MDIMWALNDPHFPTVQQLMDIPDEVEKAISTPSRAFVRDRKAMASTLADVKELPNAYIFEVDMPGIGSGEIKVQVEDNLLVISGERRREDERKCVVQEEKEKKKEKKKEKEKEKEITGGAPSAKYLRMERRMGKFIRKFPLPEDANTEAITAACKDGVLTVMVEKLPPSETKKTKTIQVQVA